VLRAQERLVGPLPGSRYVPIAPGRRAGIIVLRDTTPDEEEDLLESTALQSAANASASDEEEPEPPAPFEFTG
jgi:26S proteasome regulatory subunit N2